MTKSARGANCIEDAVEKMLKSIFTEELRKLIRYEGGHTLQVKNFKIMDSIVGETLLFQMLIN